MKPNSTPPLTLYLSGTRIFSGRKRSLTPRYTLAAVVSLLNLMHAELITCSVVVYTLPRVAARVSHASAFSMSASEMSCPSRSTRSLPIARNTPLYFSNIGPVYIRAPMNSSQFIGFSFASLSSPFLMLKLASKWLSRYVLRGPGLRVPVASTGAVGSSLSYGFGGRFSLGHCGSRPGDASVASRSAVGSTTKYHSKCGVVSVT
mmetsp:Transcript_8876/g.27219  ORF Transcript_8876/g.27219 Transcript_8876/m.27219 type:complete len:204 (+) Transcript_8876:239-850(+)